MQYPFFTKETINAELTKLSLLDEDERGKKVEYIKGWLAWLLRKKLLSPKEYSSYLLRLNVSPKPRKSIDSSTNINQSSVLSSLNSKPVQIIIFIQILLIIGLFLFYWRLSDTKSFLLPEESKGRTLSYKGKLNTTDGALVEKRDMIFRIYGDSVTTEALYTGQCIGEDAIEPTYDGSFSIVIGSDCNMELIPDELFLEYQELYLGVTIGTESELTPRYRIVTAGNSQNAEKLQGLQTGSIKGSIPVITQDNELLFETESPTLKSTNGTFTVTGSTVHIKALGDVSGTVLIDPGPAGKTIISGGGVGIGLFDPKFPFVVSSLNNDNSIGSLVNLSSNDSQQTNVLRLNVGTPVTGSQTNFVEFYGNALSDDTGDKVGGIRLNNGGVAYETAGADFAEYMNVQGSVKPGILISLGENGLHPAVPEEVIVGVVSDKAGFIGNMSSKSDTTLVGMLGQLEVLVTDESGGFKKGQPISASLKFPGFGRSFSEAQRSFIVGYAAETLDANIFSSDYCPKDMNSTKSSIKCSKLKIILQPSRW
ncbi:MAG: hypothetical protein ACEQSA_00185 [Weeksellaceae bacterium]